MKSHFLIQSICLLTSTGCLGIPYILAGYWPIVLFFLAMGAFWILMKRKSVFWSTSIVFSVFAFLAAVGILANLPTPLMVIACTAALAWWDLANFRYGLVVGQPAENYASLEKNHLRSLALAGSAGLILALATSYFNLQISFIGTVLLVLFSIGSLTYTMESLIKKNV